MEFFTIPDGLNIGRKEFEGLQIIPYESVGNSMRHRVMFKCHVLSFLIQGKKVIHQEAQPIELEEDSFVLIKMGKCLMTERNKGGNYRSLMLCFEDQYLQNFRMKYHSSLSKAKNTNNIVSFYYDDFSKNFRESLQLLFQAGGDQGMMAIKLEEILLYLFHKQPERISSLLSESKNEEEVLFRKVVENNLLLGLKLEELAFLCHMSLSTFKRHFQKYYGTSPQKWMLEKKMEMAGILLRKTKAPRRCMHRLATKLLQTLPRPSNNTTKSAPPLPKFEPLGPPNRLLGTFNLSHFI